MSKIPLPILYDQLYEKGQKILDENDPCGIHTNADGKVVCARGEPCCNGCRFLGPTGCTVQALSCKLWLCFEVTRQRPFTAAQLDLVADEAYNAGIPLVIRASKEQTFKRQGSGCRMPNNGYDDAIWDDSFLGHRRHNVHSGLSAPFAGSWENQKLKTDITIQEK